MFQESALFPWLDALGNVMFGLKLKPESHATSERPEIAYRFLKLVGLEKFAHAHYPRAVRRHEAARRAGARARARSARAADGRAVRRARRDDARAALRRHPADLEGRAGRRSSSSRTTCARRSASATASSCCRRAPAGSCGRFDIPLPRPRDINSVELATHAGRIAAALQRPGERGGRMKRALVATLFFLALLGAVAACVVERPLVAGAAALAASCRRVSLPQRCRTAR